VDRAIGAGLVVRLAARDRSRAVFVELTEHGHRVVEDAAGRLLSHEQGLVDHLQPAQQEELAKLIAALLTGLAERAAVRAEG
jgi:DNA-binding MarR family transcriptional regulator